MFGFLKSSRYSDEQLGQFIHRSEYWMGKMSLMPYGEMELLIEGEPGTPDETLIALAKALPEQYPSIHPHIETTLYKHFLPRMEAVAHREIKEDSSEEDKMMYTPNPKLMWSQVYPAYLFLHNLDDLPTIDIVYRLEWDAHRTVTARIRDGQFENIIDSHDVNY